MKCIPDIPNILSLEEMVLLARNKQKEGKKIVFTNGCYDIVHPGHIALLAEAKSFGDILILALNSDDSVKRQSKQLPRPIVSFEARAFIAANIRSVDYVISFNEDTPFNVIEQLQPDVLVKGGDWAIENIVGAELVLKKGGRVERIELIDGYSTTALIHKIRDL
ncbi:MAG: D-glycero-beta-D-manno-heptose 1-phosphate adenylyltransferase [Desulfovibrionaceae bacterium]